MEIGKRRDKERQGEIKERRFMGRERGKGKGGSWEGKEGKERKVHGKERGKRIISRPGSGTEGEGQGDEQHPGLRQLVGGE